MLMAALGAAISAEPLTQPGVPMTVITTPHLEAYVPAAQAAALTPTVLRAEVLYTAMARQAGYTITRPLRLLFNDAFDDHNGFSTVIPFPLVGIDLAPARPMSGIFDGADHLERTLIHEFAHHLSNDRNHGFRRGLERIFGRVLPSELLSLLVFYLSTPANVTMPSFWHEGLAQWAETAYAPSGSAWGGRGRDPLTHMIWRLDAAAGRIPPAGEWKLSFSRWPYGSRAYLYGAAYTRWLEARFGRTADLWKLIDAHAHQWAFAFNNGSEALLGQTHAALIPQARFDLLAEQERQLAILRRQSVTRTTRLTPPDSTVSVPAWTTERTLFAALNTPLARPTFVTIDDRGRTTSAWRSAYAMGEARSLADGTLIYAETPGGLYRAADSRVYVLRAGQAFTLDGARLLQPDATLLLGQADGATRLRIAAIQLRAAGTQALVWSDVTLRSGVLTNEAGQANWHDWPVQGRAWSPTFRPGHAELAWIETDERGSRLLLAPLGEPERRTVLAEVRGRLLNPSWSADGAELFVCADHSGVANAYVLDPATPGSLVALTNTIGGVTACVPSFDGQELALIDHDVHGPYLTRIANDRKRRLGTIPQLTCAWPAPLDGDQAPRVIEPLSADGADPLVASSRAYRGLSHIRPWFWTPTTFAAPEGGFGLTALATDPLFTHQVIAGVGIGPNGDEPVGMFSWIYSGWPIEIGAIAEQNERTYNDLLIASNGEEFDYVERVASSALLVGAGLNGFRTRLQAYLSGGVADYRTSDRGAEEYAGRTILTRPAFRGSERFAAVTIGYDDQLFTPTGYAGDNGLTGTLTYRRSGFGGDLERNRVIANGNAALMIWPAQGHQLVFGGQLGWSDGKDTLQGAFSVGGVLGLGLPRGYDTIQQTGDHLLGGSVAYRLPLWRPFTSFGSSPWVHRQVVLEGFYDAAEVSTDRFLGNGRLYQSVGGELHDAWEFYGILLQPGLGVAQQLDGKEETVVYLSLGFRG